MAKRVRFITAIDRWAKIAFCSKIVQISIARAKFFMAQPSSKHARISRGVNLLPQDKRMLGNLFALLGMLDIY